MKLLRVAAALLLLAVCASSFADAVSIEQTKPKGKVTDHAGMFSPDAQVRLAQRLDQFYNAGVPHGTVPRDDLNVQLYVYTLDVAKRATPDETVAALYRDWRSIARDFGTYHEREVIIFLFPRQRQARIVAGKEIPPNVVAAAQAIEPDLASIFSGNAEANLVRVMDRMAAAIPIPATYSDPPPVPADPGGPLFGTSRRSDAATSALAVAFSTASQKAGHPIVLVQQPEMNDFTPEQRIEQLASAWPGRTLLLVGLFPPDSLEFGVKLRPADSVKARFRKEDVTRIESEILEAQKHGDLDLALIRSVGEIAGIASGHPQIAWSPWQHPIQALLGGRDASDETRMKRGGQLFFGGAALLMILIWFVYFIKNPRAAMGVLIGFVAEGVFSSIGGGGGGDGGSGGGYSGGGGSFGGGGASGGW